MRNEINSSGKLLTPITGEPLAVNPAVPQQARDALRQALLTDNWPAFEALAFGGNPEIDIETEQYDNGQNCLHVAITAGKKTIASNLVKLASERGLNLVNSRDHAGYTPIVYAAKFQADNRELIDALIKAGARDQVTTALQFAAERGHAELVRRLLGVSGANGPRALVNILRQNDNATRVKSAQLVISLGVDATEALDYATQRNYLGVIRPLILLGAKGSDILVSVVTHPDPNDQSRMKSRLKALIQGGSDVSAAMISLAKMPGSAANREAMRRLILDSDGALSTFPVEMMLKLAESGDRAAVRAFVAAMSPDFSASLELSYHVALSELATRGNVEAIKVLMVYGQEDPEAHLDGFIRSRNLLEARVLVHARVPTTKTLAKLLDRTSAGQADLDDVIKLLVIAGADASGLPSEMTLDMDNTRLEIGKFSPRERAEALFTAAMEGKTADIAMLLRQGVDVAPVLRKLSHTDGQRGVRALVDAGLSVSKTLVKLVRAGDMESAKVLCTLGGASVETGIHAALIDLIAQNDDETLLAFIPAVTDGKYALTQAIQSKEEDLARLFLDIGADGPGALLGLLRKRSREEAGRLITLGVDMHRVLLRAVRESSSDVIDVTYADVIDDLKMMGAELPIALTRALELHDIDTARKVLSLGGTSVGRDAFLILIEDDKLAGSVKADRLRLMLKLGVNTDEALQKLIDDRKIAQLEAAIALGAPTVGLLMDCGKARNRMDAQTLILAGADVDTAMARLASNHELAANSVLGVALAGAKARIMEAQQKKAGS